MERLIKRIAFVAGASSGIGAAVCKALVKEGMIVIGCDKNVEKVQKLAETEDVSKSVNGQLHAMKCDLSKPDEITSMFKKIRKDFKCLDVFVNSASYASLSSLMGGKTTEEWGSMPQESVLNTSMCTLEARKLMVDTEVRCGRVIQIGSHIGHTVPEIPRATPIPRSQQDKLLHLLGFIAGSLQHKVDWDASNIHITTIIPEPVQTELMTRTRSPEDAAKFYGSVRFIQPEDVADAVLYILQSPARLRVKNVGVHSMECHL